MAADMVKAARHRSKTVLKPAKGFFDFAAKTVKVASDICHAFAQGPGYVRQVNQINRLVGALHGALGQITDFLGDDGETAPVFASACRLDRGIERQKLDALADIFDCTQHLGCTFGLGFKVLADLFKVASNGIGLG